MKSNIIEEVKNELEEAKRNKVKVYVKKQLASIESDEEEISRAKAEHKRTMKRLNKSIKRAHKRLNAVEDGDFTKALEDEGSHSVSTAYSAPYGLNYLISGSPSPFLGRPYC